MEFKILITFPPFHFSQTHIPWCDTHEHIAAIG